jgi:tight adherence protein C
MNVPPTAVIAALAGGFAVSTGAIAYSLIPVKSEAAKRLEEIENLTFNRGERWSDAFTRIFSAKQRTGIAQLLQEAGWYTVTPALIGMRIVAFSVLGLVFGMGFIAVMGSTDPPYLFALALMTFGGAYLPYSQLRGAVKNRKKAVQRALPDFLDMLASTVQAGLAFNGALAQAMEVVPGPLGEEVKASISEVRLGRSRADALKSMANRVRQEQLTSSVRAIVQAERLGSNMAEVLEELAEEVRNARMMRAEELANLMPTKMVIPMALFMLPALFLMIFGSVFIQFLVPGADVGTP